MITIKSALCMLLPILIYAGSFSSSTDKEVSYEPSLNLIYIGINEVNKKEKVGYSIVNYMILNPDDGSKTFIFPKENQTTINSILFETMYDSTEKRMILNLRNDLPYSFRTNPEFVINNELIEKRTPKDKILFTLNDGYEKPLEIWTCLKNGKELKKIATVLNSNSWHIDIKNCKIRIIKQKGFETSFDQFDW